MNSLATYKRATVLKASRNFYNTHEQTLSENERLLNVYREYNGEETLSKCFKEMFNLLFDYYIPETDDYLTHAVKHRIVLKEGDIFKGLREFSHSDGDCYLDEKSSEAVNKYFDYNG